MHLNLTKEIKPKTLKESLMSIIETICSVLHLWTEIQWAFGSLSESLLHNGILKSIYC